MRSGCRTGYSSKVRYEQMRFRPPAHGALTYRSYSGQRKARKVTLECFGGHSVCAGYSTVPYCKVATAKLTNILVTILYSGPPLHLKRKFKVPSFDTSQSTLHSSAVLDCTQLIYVYSELLPVVQFCHSTV